MKIAIDARLYGLENAGLGRYAINLVREFSKLDQKNKYFILLRRKYFQSLALPPNWEKVLVDFRHYSFNEQLKLPKIIGNIQPDLVHFLHFNVPIFYNEPYVVTIHDMLMHRQRGLAATTLNPFMYLIKRLGYKSVFDHAAKRALKVIVPSNSVKKELVEYFGLDPDKFVVTYQAVDEEIKVSSGEMVMKKYSLSKPYFVYNGNAYPHKNLNRAIEAVVQLNKVYEGQVFFVIASARNIFVKRLKRQVKELRAEKYIKLLGYVTDQELGGLYSSSVGFIYPSISEGFGLQGLEAMKVGTLLLASEIPVFKEIYKDNAIYFNPLDFSSIEKAMEEALSMSEEERKRRTSAAKDFAAGYSWAKMAQETLKVYEDCASLR
jgi:glycosyltransferase involved in cell wall biosynthesis